MNRFLIEGPNLLIAAVAMLWLGRFITARVNLLNQNNIPYAVTGGLLCSVVLSVVYGLFDLQIDFDMALRDTLLLTFFSTIGLSAKVRALRAGGWTLVILLGISILMLVVQDITGVLIALAMGEHPAYGLFAGSISFAGGHGTAIAWGQTAEEIGLADASIIGIACATFGLVVGGVAGGPVGTYLIHRHSLAKESDSRFSYAVAHSEEEENTKTLPLEAVFNTLLLLAVCVGVGHNLNFWLQGMGVALPQFLTAMLVGIMLTNLADLFKLQFNNAMLDRAGEISLQLFLVLSLMSMQFWLIADAFGPLIIILLLQTLFIVLLAVFVVFRFCGRDYDASVIASGFVGMGMGATPVAMANMHALTGHFGHSPKAFLVVPIVGAFFMDLSNAAVIQLFISLPLFQ